MVRKILSLSILILSAFLQTMAQRVEWQLVQETSDLVSLPVGLDEGTYRLYTANIDDVRSAIAGRVTNEIERIEVMLPTPNGRHRSFQVWETPIMAEGLAKRYPFIRTFTGLASDDKTVTVKIDFTPSGFHAMVYDYEKTFIIDPVSPAGNDYIVYLKSGAIRNDARSMSCLVGDLLDGDLKMNKMIVGKPGLPGNTPLKVNGAIKRTYRLALAATVEYSKAVGGSSPTKASVLSAMITTMNRVNGVYERELGITMQLVPNNDTLIFLAEPDGYTNSSGGSMLSQNQDTVDKRIGQLNYDIGHVFSTGGGGIADLGCVCDFYSKAGGVTGQPNPVGDPFAIDYVAHEMGHQFGATHTFNANFSAGSCTGNASSLSAYEPGSGSTIMAYAGICGSGNNLQGNSDDYFHAKSLDQITNFIASSSLATCGTKNASGNVPPVLPSFTAVYNIPYLTPFELTAPDAVDADHDYITYCWEEWDLGDFGQSWANTNQNGPIFRSFKPTTSKTRVFPSLDKLLVNTTSYVGEKLPSTTRDLSFRLTARDFYNATGTFNFPNDEITLHVVNTGVPFAVTSPNASGDYWQMGTNVPVSWNVASTTSSPINCANVDILLSVDGGYTYPHVLVSGTANDGSETITVPNIPTLSARVKVKGSGNVFFDISNANFRINSWPASVETVPDEVLRIYPNPVHDVLTVSLKEEKPVEMIITSVLGQTVWQENAQRKAEINVSGWAKGVYYLQAKIAGSNEMLVRKFVVR